MQAEATTHQLTHIGNLPGILMPSEIVTANLRGLGYTWKAVRLRTGLHAARQTLVAARQRQRARFGLDPQPVLSVSAFLLPEVLDGLRTTPEQAIKTQLDLLEEARTWRWDVHLITHTGAAAVTAALRPRTYDTILVGDPVNPNAAYWQASDMTEPHEVWMDDAAGLRAAAGAYAAATQNAYGTAETYEKLVAALQESPHWEAAVK